MIVEELFLKAKCFTNAFILVNVLKLNKKL